MTALDGSQFLLAMRRVAATVNVVTVAEEGIPIGMTATAVSSLAEDPPSLLVCINRSASIHNALADATHFCVNVLHHDQLEIARTFSNSELRAIRFASGGWCHEEGLPPYLPEAQASLLCERSQLVAFGTHTICIGTVIRVRLRADVDPLLYLNRKFCSLGSSSGADSAKVAPR